MAQDSRLPLGFSSQEADSLLREAQVLVELVENSHVRFLVK